MPAPFNFLTIFFVLSIYFIDETRHLNLNLQFSRLSFVIIILENVVQLSFISTLLYPLCLIKSYLHLTYEIIFNFSKKAFLRYLFEMAVRPFRLIYIIYYDVQFLITHSYAESATKEKLKENNTVFLKEAVYFLNTLLLYKIKSDKNSRVNLEEIVKDIKATNGMISLLKERFTKGVYTAVRPSMIGNDLNTSFGMKDTTSDLVKSCLKIAESLADSNQIIDITVSIHNLPYEINYSPLEESLFKHYNFGQQSKALSKFHFLHSDYHPTLTAKKMRLMINKLLIKLKVINRLMPSSSDSECPSEGSSSDS